jgi:hypothetical protein
VRHRRERGWKSVAGAALVIASVLPSVGTAQEADRGEGIIIGLAAGPHLAQSRNRFVGVEQGIHLGFSLGRAVSGTTAISLLLDAYAGSTMESIPGCVPDTPTYCDARTEYPGAMVGVAAESRWRPGSGRLGLALGAGIVTAPGAKGPVRTSSASLSAAADWSFGASGLVPVIGVRFTQMLTDVAGVRWIAAPVVGIRF